jgi:hypothetical protein
MIRIEVRRWSGALGNPKVVARLRRKIAGGIASKECVLLDFEGVATLSFRIVEELIRGWPEEKFRVGNLFPPPQEEG